MLKHLSWCCYQDLSVKEIARNRDIICPQYEVRVVDVYKVVKRKRDFEESVDIFNNDIFKEKVPIFVLFSFTVK